MRNTTAEIKTTMSKRRNFVNYATFTLSDGTVLHLTPADFRIGGNEFTDDLVYGDSFQVGTAIGKSISIRLDNSDDRFSQYDFYKAYFYLDIHLPDAYEDEHGDLQDGVFRIGKFTVLEPSTTGAVIDISGVDEMYKFDISFDDCTLDFTTQPTLYTLLRRCCTDCGVAIGFSSFSNQNFRVNVKPEGATYREVVSFVCQIAGVNAKISNTGALILQWYDMTVFNDDGLDGGTFIHPGQSAYQDGDNADGGSFNPWNTGYVADGGSFLDYLDYHQLYNIKHCVVSTDDIQFTGVRVINDDNAVLVGTSDYVLTLTDNPFTASSPTTVAQFLYNKITQLKFRPFSCSAIQDPTIEAGDAALVYDIKGNVYKTIITNVTFSTGGYMSIACKAQSPTRQQSTYKNPAAEAVVKARREAEKQIDEYAQTVDHFNEIANNALGYYRTDVVESGATITYLHDQPTLQTSQYIIKINSAGIFISEDGGESYTSGYEVSTATMLLNLVYAHGIVADWIASGIFQDKHGNFVLDMDNGTLKLDLSTQVGDTTLSGMLTSINANAKGLSTEVTRAMLAESTLNGNYSGNYIPTLSNEPAVNWNEGEKATHTGDIFINKDTGDVYMFRYVEDGAITITFDAQSTTESINYDYCIVYYWDENTQKYKHTNRLGGNGTSNTISGASLTIPSSRFYVYWHTDSSSHDYYGFKIDTASVVYDYNPSVVASQFPNSANALPTTVTNTLTGVSTKPETEHSPYSDDQNILWDWDTQYMLNGYGWELQTDITELSSQITQTAEQIELKVSKSDYNGNTIVSLLNLDATTATIQASKINLQGYVTITDLSTADATIIDGSNIKTGYISADRIEAGTITSSKLDNTTQTAISASTALYGTCSTDAATYAKVVDCANFCLFTGATITVKFSWANTYTSGISLNVNSTGAKTIKVAGLPTSSANRLLWASGANITFKYDGSYWVVEGYPQPLYGTSTSGSNATAKTSSINGAVICKGTTASIDFSYANSASSVTLNISSTGDYTVYSKKNATTFDDTSNWQANQNVVFVFDGTYWRLTDTSALDKAAGASGAVAQQQTIYKSVSSGTSSVTAPTSWITTGSDGRDHQNTWTIKRPTYSSNYPVLFVATQVKQVNGTVTCTTPVKDETTTVIDGGHITTGTIDASTVTVTNLSANSIKGGTLKLGGANDTNGTIECYNNSNKKIFSVSKQGVYFYSGGNATAWIQENGSITAQGILCTSLGAFGSSYFVTLDTLDGTVRGGRVNGNSSEINFMSGSNPYMTLDADRITLDTSELYMGSSKGYTGTVGAYYKVNVNQGQYAWNSLTFSNGILVGSGYHAHES